LWWKGELIKLGPDAERGNRKGQFMMCRIGDQGTYEDGNVYAGTASQNASEIDLKISQIDRMIAWHADRKAKGISCHLSNKRGDAHPKSRAVITPDGRYGSITMASEACGITRQAGFYRVKNGMWQYE
jgi:hypothetical protein